jgi:hypothetical protein
MHQPRSPWTSPSPRATAQTLTDPGHERAVQLAGSRDAAVRAALAADRETPIGVLAHLATDVEPAVRAAVAANQAVAVSVATVRQLAQDADATVRQALANNHAVPPGAREPDSAAR